MKKPKTEGLEWLQHSLISFNGSGYAQRDSGKSFLDSYIKYNEWKRRQRGVELANKYYYAVLPLAEHLKDCVSETTHKPNAKNYADFLDFCGIVV